MLIWTNENEEIDSIIQEMQLKSKNHYDNAVFEWDPYIQSDEIKETGKNSSMIVKYKVDNLTIPFFSLG